jgi:hypothetical protein
MFYAIFKMPVKSVDETFIAGECLKRNGIDEVGGIFRHNDSNIRPLFFQHTCQRSNFIGRDASGYTQYDFSAGQHSIISFQTVWQQPVLL